MQRGREILSNLVPVERPDFIRSTGPTCQHCGTGLSENIKKVMDVRGIKYCPVCVLDDVHPFSDPQDLTEMSSKKELESMIIEVFDAPPSDVRTDGASLPGVYILWSPAREERLDEFLEIGKLGKFFSRILNAARGNGLLYIGKSQKVVHRVWQHIRRDGALLTTVMPPTKLVAVDWKPPEVSLDTLEEKVGRQVKRAVDENGYDMSVYWD